MSLIGLWLGCNQIGGIQEGKPYPDACKTIADCETRVPSCRVTTCDNERCVYVDAPEGQPLPEAEQTLGDCAEWRCDGKGQKRLDVVENDIEDDGEACTVDDCVGTSPRHTSLGSIPCYSGPPGTDTTGNCKKGFQLCDNGKPVGRCLNERTPLQETCLTIFDDDCDGDVNEEGPGCVCAPGSVGACYPGIEEWIGNGACLAGTQLCNPTGTAFGMCTGFVLPQPEMCSTITQDDDCDGQFNEEGPDCTCGDGAVSNAETCDDKNQVDNDICTNACKLPQCGDGKVGPTELCDDGNDNDNDACTRFCLAAKCGDGIVQANVEQCDDGNQNEDDACSNTCHPTPVDIASGANYHCVLFSDGSVKCWGANNFGQLGRGDLTNRGTSPNDMGSNLPTVDLGANQRATAIVAGANHTCVILQNASVKCWGLNSDGRLGLGDKINRGDMPGQMGDALPTLDFGAGRTVKQVALTVAGGCALLDNDTLKCWGANSKGELGQGDVVPRGDDPGEMGDALPIVDFGQGRTVKAIATGELSHCVLLDNATVKCWGQNNAGYLGLGDKLNRGDMPGQMGDALPPVNVGTGLKAKQIAVAGRDSMCALLGDVMDVYVGMKCWGINFYGGLGLGDSATRGDTPATMGDALPFVDSGVSAWPALIRTQGRTCVQFLNGSLKCWGGNAFGQLGLGDKIYRGDGPGEMGMALPAVNLGQGKLVKTFNMAGVSTCAIVTGGLVKCWGGNDSGALGLGNPNPMDSLGDAPNEMGDNLPAVSLW